MTQLLPASLAVLFLAAALSPFLRVRGRFLPAGWLALLPASLFVMLLLVVSQVTAGEAPWFAADWVESLGVEFRLRLDGLSLLFALLITGIGALIVLYAHGYLEGAPNRARFLAYLFLFMGAMLGIVLADNLILLFVFWELTSIASYLLIGFNHESKEARWKALQALLVTGAGGLALLGGLILLGLAADTFAISDLLERREVILESEWLHPAMVLLLVGAFTKSAQFPFHFWLPNAMAAPTPVSAYLHSATMVKAGVYLLARFHPLFGQLPEWQWTLMAAGGVTMLYGAGRGLFETDLKRILAFTTLSVLGALVLLLGAGTELAVKSALLFLLGHALYKACLFMVAGNIDHATGTRDVRRLGALRKVMPLTMLAGGLAALSKAGFPPFIGFMGKEYVYKAGLAIENLDTLIVAAAFLTNALLLALAFKVGLHPFWHRPEPGESPDPIDPASAHETGFTLWFGPLLLAVGGLALGLLPVQLTTPLIASAASAVTGFDFPVKIVLWQGFNLPLLISGLTFAAGIAVYRIRHFVWRRPDGGRFLRRIDTEPLYDRLYQLFVEGSRRQTRLLQNGSLRVYLLVIIGTTTVLLFHRLLNLGGWPETSGFQRPGIFEAILVFVMMAAALFAVVTRSRLNALVSLGVVGLGVALLFAAHGAPDLALTQILVETMTIALFMFVVYYLPPFRSYSNRSSRVVDGVFAAGFGVVIAWLVLKATNLQFATPISDRLIEWSYPLAKGRNVVNVILVDFRAMDTFGEIVVLAVAALGVWLCLALPDRVRGDREVDGASFSRPESPKSLPLSVGARVLLPVFLLIALVALYRGHNQPGGGFIAGLIAASGYVLVSLADGVPAARHLLRVSPVGLMIGGLGVALIASLAGIFVGGAYFEGLWLPGFSVPVLGQVHLGTPLVFDLGVFLVVVGFTVRVAFSFEQIRISRSGGRPPTL